MEQVIKYNALKTADEKNDKQLAEETKGMRYEKKGRDIE